MAFVVFYTSQGITWADAVESVRAGRGHIFACVVEAVAKGATDTSLNYGFFYRHEDGTLCDCFQKTKSILKTAKTADLAFATLREVYPSFWNFSLPYLCNENLVRPGEVTDQVTLMWERQPRLSDNLS